MHGQYPKKDLKPRVLSFNQKTFDSNRGVLNCFISWKSTRLTKQHAEEYIKFLKLNENEASFWFFNDRSQDKWMFNNFSNHPVYSVYQGVRFAASKSDIFRLCILYKYGGIYTGVNRVFHQKLSKVYSETDKFIISFESNTYKSNRPQGLIPEEFRDLNIVQHTLFSPPGHKILEMAIERIVSEAHKFDRVIFESVKEAIWRFSAPYFLTDVIKDYINIHGLSEVKFYGIQFDGTCSIPVGAEYRYASSPSYLGSRRSMILNMKQNQHVRGR
jgi:mannosyltransferase OCH1-like enzyme